jgi:hypothetical protein
MQESIDARFPKDKYEDIDQETVLAFFNTNGFSSNAELP